MRPSVRVVNWKGDDINPFHGIAFLPQTLLDHDAALYKSEGVVFRQMPVITQLILNDGAGIRVGDPNYYLFRAFPGQTKIAQMFQVKWLKTTMDHTECITHCCSLNVNRWPG